VRGGDLVGRRIVLYGGEQRSDTKEEESLPYIGERLHTGVLRINSELKGDLTGLHEING
jgi:hypothetical protein